MHTAFLLAAGFGTRLRPLTLVRPKPLLPICGVPLLDHALALVRRHGHRSVLVNAHHLWPQVAAWVTDRDARFADTQIAIQVELPDILGTGGGLRAAVDDLGPRVVVVNADILCDVDLGALVVAVPQGGAAMALRVLGEGQRITAVEARDARVLAIEGVVGTPASEGGHGVPGTHFTGIHAMSAQAVARIPSDGFQCVVRTAYAQLVPRSEVGAILHTGTWVDVGTPEAYLRTNLQILSGRLSPPVDPWTRGTRGPGRSWIGAGATLRGTAKHCVLGSGSTVPPDAHLTRCVVWEDVRVPAGDWADAVFYGGPEVSGGGVLQIGEA